MTEGGRGGGRLAPRGLPPRGFHRPQEHSMRATRVVPLLALLANSACMDKDPPSAVPIPKGARSSLNAVDVWGKSQISAWNWNCDQSQPNGRVTPMIVQPMDCRDSRLVRHHTASPTPGSLVYQIFDSFADTT